MSETAHYREPDDAIEQLEHWLYHKGKWAKVWKRAAKGLRKDFYIAEGSFLDAMKLLREAEATATRLRELLRRCHAELLRVRDFVDYEPYELIDELAKELADE